MSPGARRWAAAAGGVALVTAAWFVALATPTEDDAVRPFVTRMQPGEQAVARNLAVTLEEVRRADSVTAAGWAAEGNWVVVHLDAAAAQEEFGASLVLATLEVGAATYQASERPDSLFQTSLAVGIPRQGSLAFELPPALTSGTGVLRLGLRSDPRLDALLEYEFDLGALERQPDAELRPTQWSTP